MPPQALWASLIGSLLAPLLNYSTGHKSIAQHGCTGAVEVQSTGHTLKRQRKTLSLRSLAPWWSVHGTSDSLSGTPTVVFRVTTSNLPQPIDFSGRRVRVP